MRDLFDFGFPPEFSECHEVELDAVGCRTENAEMSRAPDATHELVS